MSVVEHVDKMVIAYSMMPSQGHGTLLRCPDSEGYIFSICQDVLKDKMIWDRADRYGAENEHRSVKYRYSEGYDLVFTVDSDEVYKTDELQKSFKYAYWGVDRFYGVDGFVNFWRSFDYACYDGFRPIRLENLHRKEHTQDLNLKQTIYHFSTCQPEPIMRYKYNVFGHAHEVRKDWLNDIYYKWKPNNQFDDVHCVAFNLWNPVPFDKSVLPSYLKSHHNYNKVLV
jgi:hypothetical protein